MLMLVLLLSSSLIRIAGASHHPTSGVTPTLPVISAGDGGTAARVFVFHTEDIGAGTCTDLVIPAAGSAVYSNCGNGIDKQYDLSETERAQLDRWIQQFQPVNYDHSDPSQSGKTNSQLYLNGQGDQAASEADIQSMVQFSERLAVEIVAQP